MESEIIPTNSHTKSRSMLSRWIDILKRLSGKGIYPSELSFLLDNPIRKFIISPKELVNRLHLTNKSVVLEIGPGPGYFSLETALNIPDGKLVLFDIQKDMLNKVRAKFEKNNLKNGYFTQGNAAALPYKNDVFDVVFLVTVLGEVTNPQKCLSSINRVMRTNSLLSITEMKGDPDLLSKEQLIKLAYEGGFKFIEDYNSFKGFTINFRKVRHIASFKD